MTTKTTTTTMVHVEVWVRLHLESRSSVATWTIVLPDFMYYVTVLKDLSYVTAQCSDAQASVGEYCRSAIAGLVHLRHCGPSAPPPEHIRSRWEFQKNQASCSRPPLRT
ncbi:hypothetical protein L6452_38906 [Arctium lappa]|uniref:Uncharacterized protein n=1 Tax=Arctium lappa TaxID=4217 RepID=A0ACB8XRE4_ARCLA|nr:hypothetical protein L6452_38906 [Arctium lappa]